MEIDGTEIRRLRMLHGYTQRELADAAKISGESVNEIEQGHRPRVFPRTLRALADALGVGTAELLKDRPVRRRRVFNMQEVIDKSAALRAELGAGWKVTAKQGTTQVCIEIEREPGGVGTGVTESAEFCGDDYDDAEAMLRQSLGIQEENLEISDIMMQMRDAGWRQKKQESDPGGRGVVIEWEPEITSARDADSAVRRISGTSRLEAYRNARRQLLG